VRRFNSRAVDRADLIKSLQKPEIVRRARIADQCLLCLCGGVNAAGLCEGCSANLNLEEWQAAREWIEGVRW